VQLKGELAGPLSQLQETSRSIAEVQRECKLEVDTDQYVESFKPFLMDVINAWSKVRIQIYRESAPLDALLLLMARPLQMYCQHGGLQLMLLGKRCVKGCCIPLSLKHGKGTLSMSRSGCAELSPSDYESM